MASLRQRIGRWIAGERGGSATTASDDRDPRGKMHGRRFDGAGRGRRLQEWVTNGASMNAEIARGARLLKERSRDLIRNDGNAMKAKRNFAVDMVGDGIKARSITGKKSIDRKLTGEFHEWAKTYANSLRGVRDVAVPGWYAQQLGVAGGWFETGEVGQRRRRRNLDDDLPVPLQIEVIESDLIDSGFSQTFQSASGGRGGKVVQGVELTPIRSLAAYHMYPEHPGDNAFISVDNGDDGFLTEGGPIGRAGRLRVDARDFALCYETLRPGQLRGIPWLSPVIVNVKDIGDGADAERVRMRMLACIGAFVMSDDIDEEGIAAIVEDADGNPIEQLEPGLIAYVRNGKEIKLPNGQAIPGYADFHRTEQARAAAGVGQTYEQWTGDLSRVNFSSIRTGTLGWRRMVSAYRVHMFIPMVCDPVWRWFIAAKIAKGELRGQVADYPVEWIVPPWHEVDTVKHHTGMRLALQNGTLTFQTAITSETGRHYLDVLDDHAEFRRELEERNLRFDDVVKPLTPDAPEVDPDDPDGAKNEGSEDCPNCGESTDEEHKHCPGCGAKLKNDDAE